MKYTDQKYLSTEQYKDASNLDARAQLHARFSTNTYGLHPWVYDQLNLPPMQRSHILELGCGPCYLWRDNAHRIPASWDVTLTDFSPGMVQQAREALGSVSHPFRFGVADAQAIPFEDARFDAVIANHMLYHVPDRARALAEIRRVLSVQPQGCLYATTVGQTHLRELRDLANSLVPGVELMTGPPPGFFYLEDGGAELVEWFSEVMLYRYEDALVVTEAEPLVAYIRSSTSAAEVDLSEESWAEFVERVERELAQHGAIHIAKDSGLFVARV